MTEGNQREAFLAGVLRAATAAVELNRRQIDAAVEIVNRQLRAIAISEQVVRQLASHMAAAESVVRKVMEQSAPALRAIQNTLANPDFFRGILEAWDRRQRQAAAVLADKGWWLAPDFPLALLNKVVELNEQGRRRSINRLLCDYYTTRRLSAMASRWNAEPLFERRKHLFREALRAHRQRQWYLSIPLLLTQVEGILADFAEQQNLPERSSVKTMARCFNVAPADTSNLVVQTWLTQLDQIFGSGYYVTEVRHPGTRRNAILHGRELRFGSEVKSTQLFLQLDTVYCLITTRSVQSAIT